MQDNEHPIDRFYRLKREAFLREWSKLQEMQKSGASSRELQKQERMAYLAGDTGD